MNKLLIIVLFFLFLWWLTPWYFCRDFKDQYHFSAYKLQLNLDDLVHNDTDTPFVLIRFYHNKLTNFPLDTYSKYLPYWDVRFLVNLISLVGIFGLLCALWYKHFSRTLILLLLFLPLIEIFLKPAIPFPLKIALFTMPLEIYSLLGINRLLTEKHDNRKIYLLLLILLWFSIWWHRVFPFEAFEFCQ